MRHEQSAQGAPNRRWTPESCRENMTAPAAERGTPGYGTLTTWGPGRLLALVCPHRAEAPEEEDWFLLGA